MILRRFAFAVALVCAALLSQLPEYVQQYRQRLGGAADELGAALAQFDTEASAQSLGRDQAIQRLKSNGDVLARERGTSVEATATRWERLQRQRAAFADAGPVSQYLVLGEGFDPTIGRAALGDFEPAVPVTVAGFVSAGVGLVGGLVLVHGLAWPVRRMRARRHAVARRA